MEKELYCPVKKIADNIVAQKAWSNKEIMRHLAIIADSEANLDYNSLYHNSTHDPVLHEVVHVKNTRELSIMAENKAWTKYDLITIFSHWSDRYLATEDHTILVSTEKNKNNDKFTKSIDSLLKDDGALFLMACSTFKKKKECLATDLAKTLHRDVYGFDRAFWGSMNKPFAKSDLSNILTIQEDKLIPNKKEFKSVDISFGSIYMIIATLIRSKWVTALIYALMSVVFLIKWKVVFSKWRTRNTNIFNKIWLKFIDGLNIEKWWFKKIEPNWI